MVSFDGCWSSCFGLHYKEPVISISNFLTVNWILRWCWVYQTKCYTRGLRLLNMMKFYQQVRPLCTFFQFPNGSRNQCCDSSIRNGSYIKSYCSMHGEIGNHLYIPISELRIGTTCGCLSDRRTKCRLHCSAPATPSCSY